jgi:2-keto-3-deoxy-6-phosphogluconate aldolase
MNNKKRACQQAVLTPSDVIKLAKFGSTSLKRYPLSDKVCIGCTK